MLLCKMFPGTIVRQDVCLRFTDLGVPHPERPQGFSAGKCSKWASFPGMISSAAVCFRRCIPRELFDCPFAPGSAKHLFCRTKVRQVTTRRFNAA
ncbi:MAG: hypothetical protein C0483_12475 [Pirellula sp.]|nr:hypothetical protein [Pirellula sp.]